jgi:hypothetical protein
MNLALDGVGGQRHDPAAFTPGKDPVPIVQEVGWAPGPVWIGAENFAPKGMRSPDLPARSESLYQLSYPGPNTGPEEIQTLVIFFPLLNQPFEFPVP